MRTTRKMIDHEFEIAVQQSGLPLILNVWGGGDGEPRRYMLSVQDGPGERNLSHSLAVGEMHSALNMLNRVLWEQKNR